MTVKSDCCGSTLRVYQPPNWHPVVYCPGCESPYLVHCRDATADEIRDNECEHEWGKSLHEGPLFDEILMICTKCGEYEE